jgi:putative peptidoglycan lipid II flippase
MSRRIAVASLIWGGSILLSRIIGIVREMVIGRTLGGGREADVFWTSFVVPDFLNYLLAGGALSIVFLPLFGGYLARGEEERGWRAFSVVANFLLVALAVTLGVLFLALPRLVPIVAPGFDGKEAATLVALTRILLPAQVFHLVGGLLSGTLQARDRHLLPALAPLVYTGSIVTGGLVGGPEAGAFGFAWGVLVGSALGPFGLPLLGNLRAGLRWHPTLDWRHPDLRRYLLRSLPIMLAFSIPVVDDWILRRVGSLLTGGAISTLQYAKTLMKVPMGIFGLATGVAAYPTISRLLAQDRRREAYETLAAATRRMLVLALLAQVVLTCAGEEISRILYGGRIPDTQHAAIGTAVGVFSIGLWAWAAQTVIARGFYAAGKTWVPPAVGTAVVVIAYPLYEMLGRRAGTTGLALASAVAISAYGIALVLLLRREFPGAADGYASFFARMAPATAAGIGAGLLLDRSVSIPGTLPRGVILALAGGIVYGAVTAVLRVPEAREILGLVARRSKPRRNDAGTGCPGGTGGA